MAGELIKRGGGHKNLPASVRRDIAFIACETKVQQALVHAKASVGDHAITEVSYLVAVQRQAETIHPHAADAIALIVNTTIQGIARSVANFNTEID
ncbi:hypothetical protein HUT19_07650 [Streptomyces sp. NA02950]|uniref:hypothetical protein n=1 Tax=Streptomyces sp. NA02950 TaxID=2742137 RepID=UPI00159014A8|nr:hypothetical protein [Streptomyces sp. NA02950]QKV91645.1 hypothetical protein HUT19_07650 [Streptomyces sp. NA02950]